MATAKAPQDGAKKVEKQLEAETGKDFVETGTNPPTLAETDKPATGLTFIETEEKPDAMHGKPTEAHIVNDKTGRMTIIYTRQGYAERPVPAGWRMATEDEIASHKGKSK